MSYFCKKCKNLISNNGEPCEKCGCKERFIEISFNESLECHDYVIGKIKNYLTSKPKIEFSSGFSFFRKTGKWHFLNRVIDRRNNLYKEYIKNEKDKVIKDFSEPLDKHQGHGSAKYVIKK